MVRGRAPLAGPAPGAPELGALEASLRPDEALVEFHSLDDRLLAWVVRRGAIRGVTIDAGRADLDARVEALRGSIFRRARDSTELARALHALLLAPLALAPGERLLVVPHGPLHYLPFQALHDGAGYLVERHAIAYAPSAGVGLQLAQRRGSGPVTLVAFGNPRNEPRYALPAAEREVRQIAALFPQQSVYLQEAATGSRFRQSAGGGALLHLATHAEVDLVDPLSSRILLAPEGRDTGFLSAREIYGLDLRRTDLVTLSACETGLGRIERGDEIAGFTRAFLNAGAATLLVSLWPVSDASTELLMSTLYRELAAGRPAAEALQAAQLAVRAQPRFAHPFYWAPFDLVGDWRLRLPPQPGAPAAGAD